MKHQLHDTVPLHGFCPLRYIFCMYIWNNRMLFDFLSIFLNFNQLFILLRKMFLPVPCVNVIQSQNIIINEKNFKKIVNIARFTLYMYPFKTTRLRTPPCGTQRFGSLTTHVTGSSRSSSNRLQPPTESGITTSSSARSSTAGSRGWPAA